MSEIPDFTKEQFEGKSLAELLDQNRDPEIIELTTVRFDDKNGVDMQHEDIDLTQRTEDQARLIAEVVLDSIPELERPTDPLVFDAVRASARIALGLLNEGPLLRPERMAYEPPHTCL